MTGDINTTRKARVHSVFTEMRASNFLTDAEWQASLAAWVAGEGPQPAVGSIVELGAAIWAAILAAREHWDIRQHFPRWAEEVAVIFDPHKDREWGQAALRVGIPGYPAKGW